MLSKEQIDFYHENGYLVVEDVLSADELAALQRVTDEFVERSRHISQHNEVFDLEPNHSAERPRLRRIKNPIAQNEVYDQTLRHPGILDRVEQLIGPGLRRQNTKLNMKEPDHGSAVEWHQDWAFYPHTNDDVLAVGVCIDDMTEENGCMLMVPGSHKGELYSHHENGVFVGAVSDPDFEPGETAKCLVRAGGITIHHARTLHASTPNHSANPRRLLLFEYCSLDSWPLLGASFDDYCASILRGEPSVRPRVAVAPVIIPLPKPENAGSIFEIQESLRRKEMAQH
ncbi:MAG: phytanoyl-CoA dioxygenase family protein [Anaerolineae bacterium]|nr:phytanoyl-CoA dioxygenase family protein [Anaerolineae bacterium]